MAEIKDKVVTVESLSALHEYNENTYLKTNGALTTLGITATETELNILDGITATTKELNYVDGVTSNIQNQLNDKAPNSHTHSYLPLVGGIMTGDITLGGAADIVASDKDFYFAHSSGDTSHRSVLLGGDGYDNGASIYLNGKDYSSNKGRFHLRASDGTSSADFTGMPDGTLNWSGNLFKVNGQQAVSYSASTNVQAFGTNNATGGTIICCGSNAYITANGARLLTAAIVPRDGLSSAPNIGYADGRYNCIYLKSNPNVSSDERFKRDITNIDVEVLADFVNKLNVVSYNYNDDAENAEARIGLTAQNVLQSNEDIAKYFVEEDDNGYYSLRPSDLVFPLIATVQKLTKEVEELKSKVN